MKNSLLVLAVILTPLSYASAKPSCYAGAELSGSSEMMSAYRDKQSMFSIAFKNFCDANRDRIVCQTKEVKKEEVKKAESDLVAGNRCAQAMEIISGKNSVIYFFNQK